MLDEVKGLHLVMGERLTCYPSRPDFTRHPTSNPLRSLRITGHVSQVGFQLRPSLSRYIDVPHLFSADTSVIAWRKSTLRMTS